MLLLHVGMLEAASHQGRNKSDDHSISESFALGTSLAINAEPAGAIAH